METDQRKVVEPEDAYDFIERSDPGDVIWGNYPDQCGICGKKIAEKDQKKGNFPNFCAWHDFKHDGLYQKLVDGELFITERKLEYWKTCRVINEAKEDCRCGRATMLAWRLPFLIMHREDLYREERTGVPMPILCNE